jgi:trk system potassium uptake protein TrkH
MSRQIVANLGFMLQLAGLVNLLPVSVGLLLNEIQTLPPLFLVTVVFLALGFLMNSLSERKELGFLSSIFFIMLSFILLSLIGAIPFFYIDPFPSANILDRFTNAFFESASGFTTTGFSFIQTPETLSSSLLVYRSTTELIGGVGIVFLLLSFFCSRDSLGRLGDALGIKRLGPNLRTNFLFILLIYSAFIAVATSFFYIIGYRDIVSSGSFAIDMLTGGFAPSPEAFSQYLNPPALITISLLMFLGSINFDLLYSVLTSRLAGLDTSEIMTYVIVLGSGTVLLMMASGVGVFDSFVHVLSMSSGTGFDYLNLTTMNETVTWLFILLMLLGGCSFSMAGGVKMDRVVAFARSCKLYVNDVLGEETTQPSGNYLIYEFAPALINIIVYVVVFVVLSLIFSTMGISLRDALFEMASALSTCGASIGAINLGMPIFYKWLIIIAMIIGRVETLPVLISVAVLCRVGMVVVGEVYRRIRNSSKRLRAPTRKGERRTGKESSEEQTRLKNGL